MSITNTRIIASCAFAPATRLTCAPIRRAPGQARTCICMKAKRNTPKRAAKGKRVGSGAGFASSASPKSSNDKTPVPAGEAVRGVVKESVSGAEGDATPHRAMVPEAGAKLEDPQADGADPPPDALVILPELSREDIVARRFSFDTNQDALVEKFADAKTRGDFAETVIANRDFVSERMLYRFTSAILQVEARKTELETREEEARNMRELRKELIAHCWSYDFPLKVALVDAETRLLAVLQGSNVKKDVARNCGKTAIDVDAFWIVIFAAVAAWEERGKENPALINVDVQKALTSAAEACETVDAISGRLSPALKMVQKILAASDPTVQEAVVAEVDDEIVAQIGCFTEQIRLFPTAAYGGLCTRMKSILNYILITKYNTSSGDLDPFRFELQPIERASRLVSFSKQSDGMKRTE